jgi:hypothetical protein
MGMNMPMANNMMGMGGGMMGMGGNMGMMGGMGLLQPSPFYAMKLTDDDRWRFQQSTRLQPSILQPTSRRQ